MGAITLPLNYIIGASGGGTSADAIMKACMPGGSLHGLIRVPALIASRDGIGAIDKAIAQRVKVYVLDRATRQSPGLLTRKMHRIFEVEEGDIFGQHGWLVKTPEEFLEEYLALNQHPAPVPLFGGEGFYSLTPHAAVAKFQRLVGRPIFTEATLQLVHPEYDLGAPMFTWPIEIRRRITARRLQARVLPFEHLAMVSGLLRVVNWMALHNGELPPPVKSHFILNPGEEEALEEARAWALKHYPRGKAVGPPVP